MKITRESIILLGLMLPLLAVAKVTSPNGKLTAVTNGNVLTVSYKKQLVLEVADACDAGQSLTFVRKVKDDYQMLAGKRLHCTNEANEYRSGNMLLRMYNDGIAFRYEYTGLQNSKVPAEQTAYIIHEGTKRWMQQWSDGYEGFFPMTTTANVKKLGGFGGATEQKDMETGLILMFNLLMFNVNHGIIRRRK